MKTQYTFKCFSTTDSGDSGTVSESDSGKSSPGTFPDHPNTIQQHTNLINTTAAKAPSNGANAGKDQISNFTSVLEMQQHELDHNNLEASPALGGVLNMNGIGDANDSSLLYGNADKLNGMKMSNHSNNLSDPGEFLFCFVNLLKILIELTWFCYFSSYVQIEFVR